MRSFTIRIAQCEEDLRRCLIVRGIVFIEEQDVPYGEEIDEHESAAVHLVAEVGEEPVGAARLRILPEGWAKLERIAVRRAWRGTGIGGGLVDCLLAEAARRGCACARLHAQAHLVEYYRRHGFRPEGGVFIEAGIPHRLMVRDSLS
jgi:predicted GNAT family N-acyltransferase